MSLAQVWWQQTIYWLGCYTWVGRNWILWTETSRDAISTKSMPL